MNLVIGNITFEGNLLIPKSFDFDTVETMSKSGDKNIYLFGETEIENSKDFIFMCEKEVGKILNYDISIESEGKIELFPYNFEEGIYEVVSFEGEEVEYDDVKERFKEHDALFSIRECEVSNRFGNRIVRVDFVY